MTAARAYVFDLDDTLYLERDYAWSGYRAVAAALADELGPPGRIVSLMQEAFAAGRRGHVFDEVLSRLGRGGDAALLERMIELYRSHHPTIQLCPDADEALRRLRATARLGLISDGWERMQALKVEALGLAGRLDAVILTDALGRDYWKPHPRAFEMMAERLGVSPGACVFVADNPRKDFVAPNALGWTTVQVRREGALYADEPPAEGGAPQRVIQTMDKLA